ncbi:MAG TPA: hypothetical protein VF215_14655 [Thermoanaerobaculia bacterium]
MSTMTHAAMPFAETRHHPVTIAVLVVLFWLGAAALVATAHAELDARSISGGGVVSIAAIIGASYAYTHLCARTAEMPHALGVGIAWLVLAIVAEIVFTTRLGRGWYGLLGSPDRPMLRNIHLFVWIFAPALFARREAEA